MFVSSDEKLLTSSRHYVHFRSCCNWLFVCLFHFVYGSVEYIDTDIRNYSECNGHFAEVSTSLFYRGMVVNIRMGIGTTGRKKEPLSDHPSKLNNGSTKMLVFSLVQIHYPLIYYYTITLSFMFVKPLLPSFLYRDIKCKYNIEIKQNSHSYRNEQRFYRFLSLVHSGSSKRTDLAILRVN